LEVFRIKKLNFEKIRKLLSKPLDKTVFITVAEIVFFVFSYFIEDIYYAAVGKNYLAGFVLCFFAIIFACNIIFIIIALPVVFIYYPIKFLKTAEKYLAEVYEVEKKLDSNKYTITLRFIDKGTEEQIRSVKVTRWKYNKFAPKKEPWFILSFKAEKNKLTDYVYVPIIVGKYGKREVVKLLKGRYERRIDYDLSKY
jgi:hypothetical protein